MISYTNILYPNKKSNLSKNTYLTLLLSTQIGAIFSSPLNAQELTISNTIENSLSTTTANNGTPANINITESGQISISSGTAITVNSNNSVFSEGPIQNLESGSITNNNIGIHFDTQLGSNLTSTLYFNDSINISSTDDDGNVGSNNYGVLVNGEGILLGNITGDTPSTINVYGNNSSGFSLQTDMIGSIQLNSVTVIGSNSNGIEILGNLTGDLKTTSTINATRSNNHGVYIGADISGNFTNLGYIFTGTNITYDEDLNEIPAVPSIASVRISSNLGEGFSNDILFTDIDGNYINVSEENLTSDFYVSDTSTIEAIAGGYALLITPEKNNNDNWSNVTIGETSSFYGNYSLMNQGTIKARGINSGQAIEAIYITGALKNNQIFTTTFTDGFFNGRWATVEATTLDADATAIHIGNYATIPELITNGIFTVTTSATTDDEGQIVGLGGDGYGLIIDSNGVLNRFENNGTFTISASGYSSSAYGIIDNSGTIQEFLNTGTFSTSNWNASTGSTVAADLSKNTTNINFYNSGQIDGDIYLGSGNNTITLDGLTEVNKEALIQEYEDAGLLEETYEPYLERSVDGTIYLGGGSTILNMSNDAKLLGGIYSPNSNLDVNLKDYSALTVLSDIELNVNNISVEDNSAITVNINGQSNFTGGIKALGSVVFADDSQLRIRIQSLIPDQGEFKIIEADTLFINNEKNIINSGNQLFIYDVTTELDNNSLSIGLRRKNAQELGISYNLGQIYEASIPALLVDSDVASAVSRAQTKEEFTDIYNEMMPNSLTQASRQIVINTNNLSVGTVSSHLDSLRQLQNKSNSRRATHGLWVQQYGSLYNQNAGTNEKSASGFTYGLAGGYEFSLSKRNTIGFSLVRNFADVQLNGSKDDKIVLGGTQLGIYSGFWFNNFFLESQANIGFLQFESDREIVFDEFVRNASADWSGSQYSSNIKLGYELNLGSISVTPTAGINYTNFKQNSYTEVDGGTAINLHIDELKTRSLASDLNLELAYTKEFNADSNLQSTLRVGIHGGWSHEHYNGPVSISANFDGFEDKFNLIGDPIMKNNYKAGSGIHFITNITAFSIKYDAIWRERYLEHSASMNFRVRF